MASRRPRGGHLDALGVDGGAGLRIPTQRYSAFAEVRGNIVLRAAQRGYVSLTVGVAYTYELVRP